MNKDVILHVPQLIISPKRFYREYIKNKNFRIIDFIVLGSIFISLITILHFFGSEINNQYSNWLNGFVYSISFIIGLSISFIYRTYLITIILNKIGLEIGFNKIGMVVGFAMVADIFVFLVPVIIQTDTLEDYIALFLKTWNFYLILIGITTMTEIKVIRGFLIVLIVFGYEIMIKYALSGIVI